MRLDQEQEPVSLEAWSQAMAGFARLRPQFSPAGSMRPEEVIAYFETRPWTASWKAMRIKQYQQALAGVEEDKKEVRVKTDEMLVVREWVEGVPVVKARPIYPTTGAALRDFEWMVPFKKTLMKPIEIPIGNWVLYFRYIGDPSADVLDDLITDAMINVTGRRLYMFVQGDDMVLINPSEGVAAAVDLAQCDLNSGKEFLVFFLGLVEDLIVGVDRSVIIAHEKRHGVGVPHPPKEYGRLDKEAADMGYKLERSTKIVKTDTGEASTSIKAACNWVATVCHMSVALEGRPLSFQSVVDSLGKSMAALGFKPEFETGSKGERILSIEEATFLGGTFLFTQRGWRWVTLKAFKSLWYPLDVFPGKPQDQMEAWAYILSLDEVAMLPIKFVHERVSKDSAWKFETIQRYERWLELFHQAERPRMASSKGPITPDEWSRQLNGLLKKTGLLEAPAAHVLETVTQFCESSTLPLAGDQGCLALFVARFGRVPARRDQKG